MGFGDDDIVPNIYHFEECHILRSIDKHMHYLFISSFIFIIFIYLFDTGKTDNVQDVAFSTSTPVFNFIIVNKETREPDHSNEGIGIYIDITFLAFDFIPINGQRYFVQYMYFD